MVTTQLPHPKRRYSDHFPEHRDRRAPAASPADPLFEQRLRQQLARELHDGPVQGVSNLAMSLAYLQKLIERNPQQAQRELAGIIGTIQSVVKEMRGMLFELRPLVLEREGLVTALREWIEQLREMTTLNIELDAPARTLTLAPEVETNTFYIIQEALQNVIKHARAQSVQIELNCIGNELHVLMRDDGQGFDVGRTQNTYTKRKSLGLVNLTERAQLIQGKISIQSTIGQGTLIHLIVPLEA